MAMEIINLEQNTDAWQNWRKEHFTASDAYNACIGDKVKVLRDKLGLQGEEVTEWMQGKFTEGHIAEDKARAILEEELGVKLPNLVGEIKLSRFGASFDGYCVEENWIFEHKLLTDSKLAQSRVEAIRNGTLITQDQYQVQHQILVSGAKYCLFVVSDGTKENRVMGKIYPDEKLQKQIVAGWHNFEDLLTKQAISEDGLLKTIAEQWSSLKTEVQEKLDLIAKLENELKEEMAKQGLSVFETQSSAGMVKVTQTTRKGSYDYSKLSKEVLQDLPRKPDTTYYRLSLTSAKDK